MNPFDRSLIELARKLPGGAVGVIGDLVADLYIFGRSKRVSREAPVMILEYEREHITLGGAANAINNLAALGARPIPIGVVGDDHAGKGIKAILSERGVPVSTIFSDSARPSTIKQRVLGSGLHTTYQQMLRIDQGSTDPVGTQVQDKIIAALDELAGRCRVLVVSDYGYGTISPGVLEAINDLAASGKTDVYVDSRYRLDRFCNPALITPNEPEAEEATGVLIRSESDVVCAAEILKEKTKAKNLCITRGKQGMYLRDEQDRETMIPIFGSDEIADVTGAGDTVMAVFAASAVAGLEIVDAARLATVAGGLVVMKSGTATVTVEEICRALEDGTDG